MTVQLRQLIRVILLKLGHTDCSMELVNTSFSLLNLFDMLSTSMHNLNWLHFSSIKKNTFVLLTSIIIFRLNNAQSIVTSGDHGKRLKPGCLK